MQPENTAITALEYLGGLRPAKSSVHKPNPCKNLKHMIGNTPLLAIRFSFRGKERLIYAKAEHINMTGSIKDRMAFHILKKAYQEGRIQPGDIIAEATSGNTGISFAAIGRALGHRVIIFMPDWMSQERTQDGNFHAYCQKCSHLGCSVYFDRALGRLECPCHRGAFDAKSGFVLMGPPQRPLDEILLQVRGGQVWAINRLSYQDTIAD